MRLALDVLAAVLLLGGSVFVLLAGLGLHRFDDFFSRLHAATKAVTFGVLLVAAGAALRLDTAPDIVRLALAAALQLVSSPAGSHILARAAYHAGTELSPLTKLDELATHRDELDLP